MSIVQIICTSFFSFTEKDLEYTNLQHVIAKAGIYTQFFNEIKLRKTAENF